MLGQLKLPGNSIISPPSATDDSSTASSSDGASPGRRGQPPRKTRQRENQRRVHNDQSATNSNSTTNCNTNNRNRRRRSSSVSFGEVTVREYDRSLGDCWDIQNGLGLGWEYYEHPAMPLPDEDEEAKHYVAKLRKNQVKKLRAKMTAWLLVSRNKRKSMGVIQADSLTDLRANDQKSIKNKNKSKSKTKNEKVPSYQDNRPTPKVREKLLKEFGFSSEEIHLSEAERKLLRIEYSTWTQTSAPNRQNRKPSALLTERFLADFREQLPDTGTITCTATDTATSADATTTATTTVTITPSTVTTKTTAVTTIDGTTGTTTTIEQQQQQ